ncbi:MAG: LCP family protein [Oscillospiraceae bacterium]
MRKQTHSYYSARPGRGGAPPPRNKQKRPLRGLLSVFLVLLLLAGFGLGAAHLYLGRFLTTGASGAVSAAYHTPREVRGSVFNLLVVGMWQEPGKNYPAGIGLTDMVLYASYDLANNKLNLLQIPRDSYVGEEAGGDGKINSLLVSAANEQDPINRLAACIANQYKLPIDRYVAVEMEALKQIVDALGGIEVYVPRDMEHGGSYLPQGLHVLDGGAVEFFVRNRYGSGFERADIDRLDNQRFFYAALFKRFLTLSFSEMRTLLPLFGEYCTTDFATIDLPRLALGAAKLKAEDVVFCKVPGATSAQGWAADPTGRGRSLYIVDVYGRGTEQEPGLAALLNQYFRTGAAAVPPEALGLPAVEIPQWVSLYPPNVQQLGAVQ